MLHSESAAIDYTELDHPTQPQRAIGQREIADADRALCMALDLLDEGRPVEADRILTAALLAFPQDDRLWLAAGICRMRRGARRAALSAFEMSAWISGDANAKELYQLVAAQA